MEYKTVVIPQEIYEEFKTYCKDTGRSVSATLSIMMMERLHSRSKGDKD